MARASESRLVYLDTHIVCWLYEGRTELLSAYADAAIEHGRLRVSPIVSLELQYLYEIRRISKSPEAVLSALAADIGLETGEEPFASVVKQACTLGWTRDPFDRLIVAETMLAQAKLVTKDGTIRKHCAAAVW
ncbi:MAG TPA: PIN domain-containing protein [Methylophilaceae bacterium]|jgi:PIN domain nuclease of toxin-antitoxin system|nr:PIN domain-containing protein [Burkholderiales bacterium]HEX5539153.1 PIN domain-containing protein [Methylophilaceae bacterium]